MKSELSTLSPARLSTLEFGLHEIEIGYSGFKRYIKNRFTEIEGTREELLVCKKGTRVFCSMMKDMWGVKWMRILEFDKNGDPHSILIYEKDVKDFIKGLYEAVKQGELHEIHRACKNFVWYPIWESEWHKEHEPKLPSHFKCSLCGYAERRKNSGIGG